MLILFNVLPDTLHLVTVYKTAVLQYKSTNYVITRQQIK